MKKEMAGKIGAGCFNAVEDDKIFVLPAKVKKLPGHFTGFFTAITFGDIRCGIGVIGVVLEGHDMPPLSRKRATFVDISKQAAVVLIIPVPAELLIGIEDRDNVVDK
jgi:hypothetical protein